LKEKKRKKGRPSHTCRNEEWKKGRPGQTPKKKNGRKEGKATHAEKRMEGRKVNHQR
jgi:hypothetical protein